MEFFEYWADRRITMQFKDKLNRTIQLAECDGTIKAYCVDDDETYIGEIRFCVQSSGGDYEEETTAACPETATISEEYQKSGIATRIIEYAKTVYGKVYFSPDMGCGGKTNQIYYSDAGLALKNSCERKGITRNVLIDNDFN